MAELFGVPFQLTPDDVANGIVSIVLTAFAVTVGVLAKFRGPARWYALFGFSFGVVTLMTNVANGFANPYLDAHQNIDWASIATGSYVAVATINLVGLPFWGLIAYAIMRLMDDYGSSRPWRRVWPWVPAAAIAACQALVFATDPPIPASAPAWWEISSYLQAYGVYLALGWMASAAIFMAPAFVRARRPGQAILAAAMSAYPVLWGTAATAFALLARVPFPLYDLYALMLAGAFISVAWWWAFARTSARAARRVAWLPAIWFAMAVALAVWTDYPLATAAIARAFDVLLVGYAILRLQYLDLDLKVRWGISKTTVAAIFVAVFFVVSELAAAIFSERWGTEIGIAAAGGLVFVIAPIMKWADRFAEGAVPKSTGAETQFLRALRIVNADGTISAEEEAELGALADDLGLSASQVLRLRRIPGRA